MIAVPQVDVDWVVHLVNEFSHAARQVAGEQDQPYPDPVVLTGPALPPLALSDLVAVADDTHCVFAAAEIGQAVDAVLNPLLDRTRPSPRAAADSTLWVIDDATGPRDQLSAAATLALLDFCCQHGSQRMGLCAAQRCADVYVDVSPAGRRRFCSTTCLNRHKVAAHRSRRRLFRSG